MASKQTPSPAKKKKAAKKLATKPASKKAAKKKPAQTKVADKKAAKQTKVADKKAAKTKAAKTWPAGAELGKYLPAATAKPAAPAEIAARLERAIEQPELELAFSNPFELLIATILAAQSTDRTINQVMPSLLARFPDAKALAASEPQEVERLILRTGFFRNKAKAIRGTAQALVERHGGEVPNTMEPLLALPGVARKTANVVLGTAFHVSAGFIVDTHVMRVAQRLALTRHSDPAQIEADLCRSFPQPRWIDLAHRFTLHGRYTCTARDPMCADCGLNELCPSRQAPPEDAWTERAERGSQRALAGVRQSRAG